MTILYRPNTFESSDMNNIFGMPLSKGSSIVSLETDDSVPDTVLVVFEDRILDIIKDLYKFRPVSVLKECSPVTVYSITLSNGGTIGLYQTPIGSPATAIFLERAIAKGARKILFFGSCGGLSDDAASGTFVIPTEAYRGEGTSFYYAEPSDSIGSRYCGLLKELMDDYGLTYVSGPVWSTDAMFRETKELVDRMKSLGCIGVEMECSTLYAMSEYHGMPIASILFVDDTLGDEWNTFQTSKVVNKDTLSKIVEIACRFGERLG